MSHEQEVDEAEKLAKLKATAHAKRIDAERAWYEYACAVDVGDERIWAFDVYEQIRTATRRF